VIPKSRYDTIDCFLASSEYNDRKVLYDEQVFEELKDGGRGVEEEDGEVSSHSTLVMFCSRLSVERVCVRTCIFVELAYFSGM